MGKGVLFELFFSFFRCLLLFDPSFHNAFFVYVYQGLLITRSFRLMFGIEGREKKEKGKGFLLTVK